MKIKLISLATTLSILFSCASKSVVTDISKTAAPLEIKVAQEVNPVENTVVTETKPVVAKFTMLTRELYESKILFENSCNQCHKLYFPNEYSKEQWPKILKNMQKNAELSDTQIIGILDYIYSQI
jgi:nitrate/TMAO reductase-like tetraheme cytochrome c subunit